MNFFFKHRHKIALAWALVALIEIVCIERSVGIPLLSESTARIVLMISYAYAASWFFYLLVVLLPERRDRCYLTPVVWSRVIYLANTIDGMRRTIENDSGITDLTSPSNMERALNQIDDRADEEYLKFERDHSRNIIKQIFVLSQYLDANTLRDVDAIDRILMHLWFGSRMEGRSLGESDSENLLELFRLISGIRCRDKRTIERVEREVFNSTNGED